MSLCPVSCHTCPTTKMLAAILLISTFRVPSTLALTDEIREVGRNVTHLLNTLLSPAGYNKNVRPNIGGTPVTVSVNMYIKSIGAISDNEEEYTMDLYFRQSWLDSRLKFGLTGLEEMSMSYLFVDKVWKPDTYFMNGKKSSIHKVTSANKFMRLRKNGYLTLSMRLTVSASCKMHLRKFPLDSQNCSLLIGSYAYTSSDIIYKWSTDGDAVVTEPGMELAQHNLIGTKTRKRYLVRRDSGEYYVIRANFVFQRSIGFFMLQVYVPCSLIICCSWVSFWINPDDVPARIQLGVIPVLSITTIGFGNRSALPKVSHATALDWYLILCFAFAFGVILEYAYINFVNKIYSDGRKVYEAKKLLAKVVETITQCSHQNPDDKDDEAYGAKTVEAASKTNEEKEQMEGKKNEVECKSGEKAEMNISGVTQDSFATETLVDIELGLESGPRDPNHFAYIDQEIDGNVQNPPSDGGKNLKMGLEKEQTGLNFLDYSGQENSINPEAPPSDGSKKGKVDVRTESPAATNLGYKGQENGTGGKNPLPDEGKNLKIGVETELPGSAYSDYIGEKNSERIPLSDGSSGFGNHGVFQETRFRNVGFSWAERLKETNLRSSIKKQLQAPVKFWRNVNILPNESDIIRKIEEENPQKFPAIDIKSRVVFPTSFSVAVLLYFVSYFYIISDENVDFNELY